MATKLVKLLELIDDGLQEGIGGVSDGYFPNLYINLEQQKAMCEVLLDTIKHHIEDFVDEEYERLYDE